ncbi:MAG: nickel pincer cofactor biosynthesis protein LarC [Bacteroidota bacterium]
MIIYIEAFSGLSGDMFLGALASLTDEHEALLSLPQKLNLTDGKIVINDVNKNGIVCKHIEVIDLNKGNHHHRHLSDIVTIIDNADITDSAKTIAKDIFNIIGKSESKIHNIPLDKIHFHEVSGVDSIIDIVGSAVLIDKLSIVKTYSTEVCTGFGFVNTQHGKLPVPAPATADILSGIPTYKGDEEGERVTPTGAAILKYLNPEFNVPSLVTEKTVYGPGKKDFIAPNVLRISSVKEIQKSDQMIVIETNIDDMSHEMLGLDFQEQLIENGALDFYFTQIQMKKGRPGILLNCLTTTTHFDKLSDFILENTSTIGLRHYIVDKKKLERSIKNINTSYGNVQVKEMITPSGSSRITVEYESLKELSEKLNMPIPVLQQKILKELNI